MGTSPSSESTVTPAQVTARRDDDLFVLDVRREDEYDEWHLEGSYNVPVYDELLDGEFGGLAAALDEIPDGKEIAVVCVAGVTSADAAAFLRERGYDAKSMADGMRGWGRLHVPYDVERAEGAIQVVRPGTGCLSYVIHDDEAAIVVDPSLYADANFDVAADRGLEIVAVIDTHAHADHVSGGRRIAAELDVPYYLHPADAGALDDFSPLEEGDAIALGDRSLDVLHTPGHTPGSVSLRFGDALLSGDTLFIDGVGRPDLEEGDETDVRAAASDLFDSLSRLAELSNDAVVLPGHFSDEEVRPLATSLGRVGEDNELFGVDSREAFVDAVVEGLSDEPANYNRIKSINWGEEPLTDEVVDLELGPNNCAAN